MSDRDIQDFLDGLSSEPLAEDQEGLAAYRMLYDALRRELPHGLPATFADGVSDRLLAPQRKPQFKREPALEWILPFLSLTPLIIFAVLQTGPLWFDRVAAALRSDAADGAMPDLLTLAAFFGGTLLIAFFDTLLGRRGRSGRLP